MRAEQSPQDVPYRIIHKARYGMDKLALVQRYKIHYVEAGQGEPVVLIPGSYRTYRAWNHWMPLLAAQYRILMLDYHEMGGSEKPREGANTIQEQTDIIAQMVLQLGLGKVHLIGGSSRGALVFDFAARYPDLVNKIVSIEGGLVDSSPGSIPSRPWYRISITRKASKNIEEDARSIKAPVLYLYGTLSHFRGIQLKENLQYLKNYLPHAWIVELEGRLHDLAMQNPSELAGLILEFLNNKTESKPRQS